MSNKNKSYCTNESFWNELDPQFKKVYKDLAKEASKQSKNKPSKNKKPHYKSLLTKQAIAQLIHQGQYTNDYHNAVSYSFGILSTQLSKQEKKVAKTCFKLSHSKYMAQLYQMVLINEKAHASLKVIAEIKGLINNTNNKDNQSNTQPTKLSINLSQEPTKKPPTDNTTDNTKDNNLSNSPPLDLMLN